MFVRYYYDIDKNELGIEIYTNEEAKKFGLL